jgi:hypothetical protein
MRSVRISVVVSDLQFQLSAEHPASRIDLISGKLSGLQPGFSEKTSGPAQFGDEPDDRTFLALSKRRQRRTCDQPGGYDARNRLLSCC